MTLSDVVTAVSEVTEDEREVIAVLLHMLRSGSVRLSTARVVVSSRTSSELSSSELCPAR